jgi:hypothetical protein
MGTTGEPLAGVTLKIAINGVQQTVITTNDDGKASWTKQLTPIDLGARNITVAASLADYEPVKVSADTFVISFWIVGCIMAIIGIGTFLLLAMGRLRKPKEGATIQASMACLKCGKSIPIESIFCPSCGTEIPRPSELGTP